MKINNFNLYIFLPISSKALLLPSPTPIIYLTKRLAQYNSRRNFFGPRPHPRSSSSSSSLTATSTLISNTTPPMMSPFPELCVFDLDACLWDKETFEMPSVPTKEKNAVYGSLGNGRGRGIIGVMSGPHQISLNPGALLGLQEHADGKKYPMMKVALASSATTPLAEDIARASLAILEVLPGITVWDLLMRDWEGKDVNQIGRRPPLSSNKAETHFPILREMTGIRYDRMLFFDDCIWYDHCAMVEELCREGRGDGLGPVTMATPDGLGVNEWRRGIQRYTQRFTENLEGYSK